MTFHEPENSTDIDRPIVDSGVHVRDTEHAPASSTQITLVAVLVVAILCVFFYGLTSQRQEVAGASAPAQQAQHVPPAQTQQKPSTTGQGSGEAPNPGNPQGAPRQQQPQKTEATPANQRGGQNQVPPPTAPQKNQ